jgi:hypothetical protein
VEMGILTNAQENAQKTIREFLRTVGVKSVRFEQAPAREILAP